MDAYYSALILFVLAAERTDDDKRYIKTDISIICHSMMALVTATHAMRIDLLLLKQFLQMYKVGTSMDHSVSTMKRSIVLHAEQLTEMFSLFSHLKAYYLTVGRMYKL